MIAAAGFTKKCRPVRLVYFNRFVIQAFDFLPLRRFQGSPVGSSGRNWSTVSGFPVSLPAGLAGIDAFAPGMSHI
jgi:hypothetical protein